MRDKLITVLAGAIGAVIFGAFGAAVGHVAQNFLNAHLFDTPVDGMELIFGIAAAAWATFKYTMNLRRKKRRRTRVYGRMG